LTENQILKPRHEIVRYDLRSDLCHASVSIDYVDRQKLQIGLFT